ncbi:MAG: hypothetical protein JRJ02_15090 [Deltaproteobacteria bacterium]|nr:hypothetical protein [Deltaproteobacteria bacterium]
MDCQYEVLSPWADANPIPAREISPRVKDLTNKVVGLFAGAKVAASPILAVVEKKLKERFPTLKFTRFHFSESMEVVETIEKAGFEKWVMGIDTAITAVGD